MELFLSFYFCLFTFYELSERPTSQLRNVLLKVKVQTLTLTLTSGKILPLTRAQPPFKFTLLILLQYYIILGSKMPLDHYSTCGLQVTFKRTKLVKPDLLPDRLTIPAFISLQGGDIIL